MCCTGPYRPGSRSCSVTYCELIQRCTDETVKESFGHRPGSEGEPPLFAGIVGHPGYELRMAHRMPVGGDLEICG